MGKIENDKQTIRYMVELYCKNKLKMNKISEEYEQLIGYAFARLEHCKYGEDKPACKNCPTHCYKQDMRSNMQTVMRWAGPRMLFYSPLAAIKHLLNH